MNPKGIGINSHRSIDGNLDAFAQDLETFHQVGFDYVEVSVHALDAVLNGQVNHRRMEQVKAIMERLPLKYTVHAPNRLNLCDLDAFADHLAVFRACLEFTHLVGAELLVYHAGVVPGNVDADAIRQAKEAELTGLREMADIAARLNVYIGVENSNVEPPIALGQRYAYGAHIDQLIEQVERIGSPWVGIAFDFGHCYTASTHYGFDYMQAVRQVMPYVNHLHIYDSFGKVNRYPDMAYQDLYTYGLDDLHLPVWWGSIPFQKIFSTISMPPVILLLELKPRFTPDAGDCLATLRALLAMSVGKC